MPAGALVQVEAGIAAGASRAILSGARRTAESVADGARDETLAWRMPIGAGASAILVVVDTHLVFLTAVQDGEGVAQPEVHRPRRESHLVSVGHDRMCLILLLLASLFCSFVANDSELPFKWPRLAFYGFHH